MKQKTIVIRLGNSCNLKCFGCHCCNINFKYNPDIINYIKNNQVVNVFFSGGEPLLYFDIIKLIIQELKSTVSYKLVTNATLLTEEMVDFFNDNNVKVIVSYNGENSKRDNSLFVRYDLVGKIKNNDLAILLEQGKDILELTKEVKALRNAYNLAHADSWYFWFNAYHQTKDGNIIISKDYFKLYCYYLGTKLELEFLDYAKTRKWGYYPLIGNSFNKWVRRNEYRGLKCCHENNITLAINGDFLLCPYGDIKVGDIYTGIDWDLVESYIPERCKNCPQWESCHNTCIANITENECYIAKVMHKHFYKLMAKYNVTYDELEEKIRW